MNVGDRVIYYKIKYGATHSKHRGVVIGFTKLRVRIKFDDGAVRAVDKDNCSVEPVGDRNKIGNAFVRDELGFSHRGSYFEVDE